MKYNSPCSLFYQKRANTSTYGKTLWRHLYATEKNKIYRNIAIEIENEANAEQNKFVHFKCEKAKNNLKKGK